jgi:hypothetical protein
MKNEWEHGRYRFLKLKNELTGNTFELPLPKAVAHKNYYCGIEFEPWLINFSHE